ncbi:MAG TPA: GAF domain-containing protein [Solirubrobacterales bacterium]|nr:GAF domain-containing protein [Solirubrobacterales bacterium]
MIAGDEPPPTLRAPIAESWRRSATAGVDPEQGLAPVTLSTDEAEERWRAHPLSIAETVLRELLADVRSDDGQVVLACDADGSLLWIDGEPAVLDAADNIHLRPGSLWSEDAAGTNAMGTALAIDHPIQVFSAEHFTEAAHGWTCSAAPVHDPESGRPLGVIDLSGPASTAHPHSLALVEAAARVIESELRWRVAERRTREMTLRLDRSPGARPRRARRAATATRPLVLTALGRDRALVDAGRGPIELSRRHSEIAALMTLHPEGLDIARLARELYGEYGLPVTARAEISRLRRILGPRLPRGAHRLDGPIEADFVIVERMVADGDTAGALAAYAGPLLPSSGVPLVIEARERIDLRLRQAAIGSGDAAMLSRWLETPSGRDDIEACRVLIAALGESDPARSAALSRLRRLSVE